MDGKGCWVDNVFIERVWRSLKYEAIYLREFDNASRLNKAVSDFNSDNNFAAVEIK